LQSRIEYVEHDRVERYGVVSQALHWATAALVLHAFINGLGGSEERVYASSRDFQRQMHETLGVCVFALTALRLLWRRFEIGPGPVPVARWMELSRKGVEVTLYVLLVAVPLTAVAGAWLEGHPLTLLAGFTVPPPPVFSHGAGLELARLHTWLGDAIVWVGAFHGLAALYHHVVLKDTAMITMLPRWLPIHQRQAPVDVDHSH
jgi:cytochrome b561